MANSSRVDQYAMSNSGIVYSEMEKPGFLYARPQLPLGGHRSQSNKHTLKALEAKIHSHILMSPVSTAITAV